MGAFLWLLFMIVLIFGGGYIGFLFNQWGWEPNDDDDPMTWPW